MSNRMTKQISLAAELRASHLAQMEALLASGLSDEERVRAFGKAAEFSEEGVRKWIEELNWGRSPAKAVWYAGHYPKSLFAHLPNCNCPVIEVSYGRKRYSDIPSQIPDDWHPTRETLEAFSRVQIEARTGQA